MIQVDILSTAANIALIGLGFVGFIIGFFSDSFRQGERRHNVLRAITLSTLLLVAALGCVTYCCGKIESRRSEEEMSTVTDSLNAANEKISKLSEAAPRIDERGRIVAGLGVSYMSEFSNGINKARTLFDEGKLADAFAEAERLSKKKPDFGLAFFVMGTVKAAEGMYDESKDFLSKAVELKLPTPDRAHAYHNLGVVALNQKNDIEARKYFEMAIKTDPNKKESSDMLNQMGFPAR